MYKVHHIPNNTDICHPDTKREAELFVHEVGHSSPPPGYSSAVTERNLYMIHYVISGCGTYFDESISPPCILFGTPQYSQVYSVLPAPDGSPYEQYWILFGGGSAASLLWEAGFPDHPKVLPCPYIHQAFQILREMQNFHHYVNRDDNLTMIAGLHQLMALHSHFSRGTQRTYSPRVQLLIHHICENYPSMITEASLAAQVNLSVQHMHRLFLSETGMSPIQYLNAYRIHCAKKMLEKDDLPIYAIAASSGFATPNYFCTVFRKFSGGLSPLEYRRAHHNTLVQKKRLSK